MVYRPDTISRPYNPTNNHELKRRLLDGDNRAWHYIEKIARETSVKITRQYDRADDVEQEALLKIYNNITKYNPSRDIRPWINTIVRRANMDRIRREKRRSCLSINRKINERRGETEFVSLVEDEQERDQERTPRSRWEPLAQYISPKEEEILRLAYERGRTQKQLASILKIPIGTVKSRLHSAAKNVKRQLELILEKRGFATCALE